MNSSDDHIPISYPLLSPLFQPCLYVDKTPKFASLLTQIIQKQAAYNSTSLSNSSTYNTLFPLISPTLHNEFELSNQALNKARLDYHMVLHLLEEIKTIIREYSDSDPTISKLSECFYTRNCKLSLESNPECITEDRSTLLGIPCSLFEKEFNWTDEENQKIDTLIKRNIKEKLETLEDIKNITQPMDSNECAESDESEKENQDINKMYCPEDQSTLDKRKISTMSTLDSISPPSPSPTSSNSHLVVLQCLRLNQLTELSHRYIKIWQEWKDKLQVQEKQVSSCRILTLATFDEEILNHYNICDYSLLLDQVLFIQATVTLFHLKIDCLSLKLKLLTLNTLLLTPSQSNPNPQPNIPFSSTSSPSHLLSSTSSKSSSSSSSGWEVHRHLYNLLSQRITALKSDIKSKDRLISSYALLEDESTETGKEMKMLRLQMKDIKKIKQQKEWALTQLNSTK